MTTIRFAPVDTWFFRNSRSMNVPGGTPAETRFPPAIRTPLGALRTLLGDALGADWVQFRADPDHYVVGGQRLRDVIGFGEDLGPLKARGPWLVYAGERLYPLPQFLGRVEKGEAASWMRARVAPPLLSDMGKIRMLDFFDGERLATPSEAGWVTVPTLQRILQGRLPEPHQVILPHDLWQNELRLGIARNRATGTVEPSYLYHANHIRLKPGVALELDVDGGPTIWPLPASVRFGADGRLAYVETVPPRAELSVPEEEDGIQGIVITFVSEAVWREGHWVPPPFEREMDGDGVVTWIGEIGGVTVRIHTGIVLPTIREGGWDLGVGTSGAPRVRRSYVPAGSSWYATLESSRSWLEAARRIQGQQIGEEAAWGRGQVVVGWWFDHEWRRQ